MTTYILMLLLVSETPRLATWTAEFTSKERCEAAGLEAAKAFKPAGGYIGVKFVCVAK